MVKCAHRHHIRTSSHFKSVNYMSGIIFPIFFYYCGIDDLGPGVPTPWAKPRDSFPFPKKQNICTCLTILTLFHDQI